ncbi:MAG TPA: hypothetical protein PLK59_00045 [Synergistales bacterium]|nr:hypothetical protein [Synergistales bacterium]
MQFFSREALSALKFYVYTLEDENGNIFYIGKGSGNRCFSHANLNGKPQFPHEGETMEDLKAEKIRELRETSGSDPQILIIAHGLEEETAFIIESLLIKLVSIKFPEIIKLGNRVLGHKPEGFCLLAEELNNRLSNPVIESDLEERVLLVSLNGGKAGDPYPKFCHEEGTIAQRTLGRWSLDERKARKVDLIAGVYKGLIRCVFKVKKKKINGHDVSEYSEEAYVTDKGQNRKRFNFSGERDIEKEEKWALRSIQSGNGDTLTVFPRGGAIRYANWKR